MASTGCSRLDQLLWALLSVNPASGVEHGRRACGSLGATQIQVAQDACNAGLGLAGTVEIAPDKPASALATWRRGWTIGAG